MHCIDFKKAYALLDFLNRNDEKQGSNFEWLYVEIAKIKYLNMKSLFWQTVIQLNRYVTVFNQLQVV